VPLVNFILKHPDQVSGWGGPQWQTMHWFGLTDSLYWIEGGAAKIFEYTDEIRRHWNMPDLKYVDYHLVRLVEDWQSIFDSLAEPVPDDLYEICSDHASLYKFYRKASSWLEVLSDDPSVDIDTYYDKYDKLIEWMYTRTSGAMHLNHGPDISFFRNRDNLSIVWDADHTEENIPVWTAQTGAIEMKYTDFIAELQDFGKRFFKAMEQQVALAVAKDWGAIELDKQRLVEEHKERQAAFEASLLQLQKEPVKKTDWDLVRSLMREMNAR
jgi:hypothetical protein